MGTWGLRSIAPSGDAFAMLAFFLLGFLRLEVFDRDYLQPCPRGFGSWWDWFFRLLLEHQPASAPTSTSSLESW